MARLGRGYAQQARVIARPVAPVAAPPGTGQPKVWDGSAFVNKPAKVWDGSAWVEKPVKVWSGTAWVSAR
jgi:hypothetical protein